MEIVAGASPARRCVGRRRHDGRVVAGACDRVGRVQRVAHRLPHGSLFALLLLLPLLILDPSMGRDSFDVDCNKFERDSLERGVRARGVFVVVRRRRASRLAMIGMFFAGCTVQGRSLAAGASMGAAFQRGARRDRGVGGVAATGERAVPGPGQFGTVACKYR